MTREEMLNKLMHIKPGSEVTICGEDYLAVTVVSKYGVHNYGAWDIDEISFYKFEIDKKRLEEIVMKIRASSLKSEDVKGTPLENIFSNAKEHFDNIDTADLFENLVSMGKWQGGAIYMIANFNAKEQPSFYGDYETFSLAVEKYYSYEPWEDCEDEELQCYLEQIESGSLDGITMITVSNEKDTD